MKYKPAQLDGKDLPRLMLVSDSSQISPITKTWVRFIDDDGRFCAFGDDSGPSPRDDQGPEVRLNRWDNAIEIEPEPTKRPFTRAEMGEVRGVINSVGNELRIIEAQGEMVYYGWRDEERNVCRSSYSALMEEYDRFDFVTFDNRIIPTYKEI